MIKHVHIKNFKSLEDVAVDLDPVTVFIGRSGSGKSNFVDALRFLRDILTARSGDIVEERFGGWERVMSATSPRPMRVSFHVVFAAPGFREEFEYELNFQQPNAKSAPQFFEEKLVLGGRLLFHQQQSKWLHEPALVKPPQPG